MTSEQRREPELREEEQVVDEVRRAREEVWRRAGGSAAGLVQFLRKAMPRPEGRSDTTRRGEGEPPARRSA